MPNDPRISIGQYSAAGLKERNDDSYGIVIPKSPLLETKGIAMAIADGMSTSVAAKEASESCIKSFLEDYYCTHESWAVKKAVGSVLGAINQWLYRQGQVQYLSDRGMVSTFSGAVLKSGTLHIFHAGDSRISLLRNGDVEPLTKDHQVRISRTESYLARAFGIEPDLDVDYRAVSMSDGDALVFTTDGVHEHVSSKEIRTSIGKYRDDPDRAAREICETALSNGSADNVTCQIIHVDHVGTDDKDSYFKRLTALPFPPDLAPDMIFEGYRIERELHASKRSQVYLAYDPQTSTRIVIKTPSVNFEDDPTYIDMFTREEWVGRRINSPNVVRIAEPKSTRNFLYYMTEYVDGQTLREWMDANPEPGLVDIRGIVDQIASGLRAFHRRDMIHQDLKPDNIIIDNNSTVKIVDFGSTRVAGLAEISSPINRPDLVGTIDYTAPEYHLGHRASKLSDIYSLGAIAYEMHTGKLPFGEGFAKKSDLGKLKYCPATEHRPNLPIWISGALGKAVERNPAKRYDVLSAFLADLTRPNPEFETTDTLPMLESDPARFWRLIAIGSAIINLILLIKLVG